MRIFYSHFTTSIYQVSPVFGIPQKRSPSLVHIYMPLSRSQHGKGTGSVKVTSLFTLKVHSTVVVRVLKYFMKLAL